MIRELFKSIKRFIHGAAYISDDREIKTKKIIPPTLPKHEIGPTSSITREKLTIKEINERYPGALLGAEIKSGFSGKEYLQKLNEAERFAKMTESLGEHYIRLRENVSAMRKWIHETEEREIIDYLLKFDREALVRLNTYISKALTQAKEK
jgi:hypothetical protein